MYFLGIYWVVYIYMYVLLYQLLLYINYYYISTIIISQLLLYINYYYISTICYCTSAMYIHYYYYTISITIMFSLAKGVYNIQAQLFSRPGPSTPLPIFLLLSSRYIIMYLCYIYICVYLISLENVLYQFCKYVYVCGK